MIMDPKRRFPSTIAEAVKRLQQQRQKSRNNAVTTTTPVDLLAVVVDCNLLSTSAVVLDHNNNNSSSLPATLWLDDGSLAPNTTACISFWKSKAQRLTREQIDVGDVIRLNRVSLYKVEEEEPIAAAATNSHEKSTTSATSSIVYHFRLASWQDPEPGAEYYRLGHLDVENVVVTSKNKDNNEPSSPHCLFVPANVNSQAVPTNVSTATSCIDRLSRWWYHQTHASTSTGSRSNMPDPRRSLLSSPPCQFRSLPQLQSSLGVTSHCVARVQQVVVVGGDDDNRITSSSSRKRQRQQQSSSPSSSSKKQLLCYALLTDVVDGTHHHLPFVASAPKFRSVLEQAAASPQDCAIELLHIQCVRQATAVGGAAAAAVRRRRRHRKQRTTPTTLSMLDMVLDNADDDDAVVVVATPDTRVKIMDISKDLQQQQLPPSSLSLTQQQTSLLSLTQQVPEQQLSPGREEDEPSSSPARTTTTATTTKIVAPVRDIWIGSTSVVQQMHNGDEGRTTSTTLASLLRGALFGHPPRQQDSHNKAPAAAAAATTSQSSTIVLDNDDQTRLFADRSILAALCGSSSDKQDTKVVVDDDGDNIDLLSSVLQGILEEGVALRWTITGDTSSRPDGEHPTSLAKVVRVSLVELPTQCS